MMQLAKKYGLLAGLVYIIVGLINLMFELSAAGNIAGILLWAIPFFGTFAIVYVAVKEFREENGSLTTGQGVKLGVTIALIAAVLGSVFTLIYTQLIDPEVMTRQMEIMVETWEDQGMSDDQIEQARTWSETLMNPFLAIPFTIIWYVIGGLIKGAISGYMLKQDAPV